MAHTDQNDDCVSKKPWGEVLARSLKLFTFNAASEGGKSLGRVAFYIILGIIVLLISTYIIDSMTGWFSSWFDFWPFNNAAEVAVEPQQQGWFNWGADKAVQDATANEVKWYCKWNPVC